MTKRETDDLGSYVQGVHERTQKYVDELAKENERLRAIVASTEREKLQLEQEYARLKGELMTIANRHERHTEEYLLVEEQNANLANLYVASFRLHGTVERSEVLDAIQEIVINLIGCEEYAVFGVGSDGASLVLLASMGIDRARFESIPFGRGRIGEVARTQERYVASSPADASFDVADDRSLTACIPLAVQGHLVGAIAIYRLLPQKPELEATDHELMDLLATHAATALAFTELYAKGRSGKKP